MKWLKPPWRAEPDNIAHWSYPFIGIILPFVIMLRSIEFYSVLYSFPIINLIFNRALLMIKLNQSSDKPILAKLEKYKHFSLIMLLVTVIIGFASAAAAFFAEAFIMGMSFMV